MRPANNLTGVPTAAGERSGVTVLNVTEGGRNATRAFFFPVGGDQTDTHALAVRLTTLAPRTLGLPFTGDGTGDPGEGDLPIAE